MSKTHKLRISRACEAGVRYDGIGHAIDNHWRCSGYEDRRLGRQFRCKCACHVKAGVFHVKDRDIEAAEDQADIASAREALAESHGERIALDEVKADLAKHNGELMMEVVERERKIDWLEKQNAELHRQLDHVRGIVWDERPASSFMFTLRQMLDRQKSQ